MDEEVNIDEDVMEDLEGETAHLERSAQNQFLRGGLNIKKLKERGVKPGSNTLANEEYYVVAMMKELEGETTSVKQGEQFGKKSFQLYDVQIEGLEGVLLKERAHSFKAKVGHGDRLGKAALTTRFMSI
ncbi:hypothetical protein SLA2020_494350 [Shorea laevis]